MSCDVGLAIGGVVAIVPNVASSVAEQSCSLEALAHYQADGVEVRVSFLRRLGSRPYLIPAMRNAHMRSAATCTVSLHTCSLCNVIDLLVTSQALRWNHH